MHGIKLGIQSLWRRLNLRRTRRRNPNNSLEIPIPMHFWFGPQRRYDFIYVNIVLIFVCVSTFNRRKFFEESQFESVSFERKPT
eukprot:UN15798